MAATPSSMAASKALLSPAISGRGLTKPNQLSFGPTGLRLSQKLQRRRNLQSARVGLIRAAAVEEVSAATSESVIDKSVNAIRFLAVDAVEKANSGHPGLPMGCAPMGHILFDEIMRYNPKNPYWFNRDRFVLSAGHGCMLHYALLHLAGYDSVMV